ncbi:MAG: hypothetical protein K2F99_08450 [Muribaculaceae bacterium]|nr:hypothetical protein [Muribaculaceae bacterium]
MSENKYVIVGIVRADKLWHTLILYELVGTEHPTLTRVRHRDLVDPINASVLLEFDREVAKHYEKYPQASMMSLEDAVAIMDAPDPNTARLVPGVWKYYIPKIKFET